MRFLVKKKKVTIIEKTFPRVNFPSSSFYVYFFNFDFYALHYYRNYCAHVATYDAGTIVTGVIYLRQVDSLKFVKYVQIHRSPSYPQCGSAIGGAPFIQCMSVIVNTSWKQRFFFIARPYNIAANNNNILTGRMVRFVYDLVNMATGYRPQLDRSRGFG